MSILTFKCKLTATAGRPVFGSISALSTGALLDARGRAVDSSTMFATGTPFATTPARLNCVLQPKGYGGTLWTVDTRNHASSTPLLRYLPFSSKLGWQHYRYCLRIKQSDSGALANYFLPQPGPSGKTKSSKQQTPATS